MIFETSFLECENVPPEMAAAFDRPWNFVGEFDESMPGLRSACVKCNRREIDARLYDYGPSKIDAFQIIHLARHAFITDELLYVVVWFGCCQKCGGVYWARSLPPYQRERQPIHSRNR